MLVKKNTLSHDLGNMENYSRLVGASFAGDDHVNLRLEDGTEACVDLSDRLWGCLLESFKHKKLLSQLRVGKEIPVLVWPNGADLAPEILHEPAMRSSQLSIA